MPGRMPFVLQIAQRHLAFSPAGWLDPRVT
jgi:hypothetical protein